MKNCEYHRVKTKQLLDEYHKCVEENMRLKEANLKLAQGKKSAEIKLEVMGKKLQLLTKKGLSTSKGKHVMANNSSQR